MIIKKSGFLTEETLKEIKAVEKQCMVHDKILRDISIDSSINYIEDINHTFLYYKEDKLIGFLYMFIPTSDEAEIQAYVLPDYRGKGYFKALLKDAEDELKKHSIEEILFVREFNPYSNRKDLKSLNAEYEFSEYCMKYSMNRAYMDKDYDVEIIKTTTKDSEDLIRISQGAFDESYEEAKELIFKSLKAENRTQYAVMYNGEYIGIGGVHIENNEATIFGLGLIEEFRGQGLGKQALHLLINELMDKDLDSILIEVDSNNEVAFELYKKTGFKVEVAFDYYRKEIV